MTKEKLSAVFAVIVFLMGMTGCTKEDSLPAIEATVQEQSLVGLWWDEIEYADVTEAGVPFSRVLLAVKANADHTGCIYLGVFSDSGTEPLAVYGGPKDAGFRWRLLADGSLLLGAPATGKSVELTRGADGSTYGQGMTDVASMSVTYADGSMTVTNGNYSGRLAKANTKKVADIQEKLGVGYTLLTKATSNDVGMVVCEAGHLHTAMNPVPDGCTAVGILGHVTKPGHGLILALQDTPRQTWTAIQGWRSASYDDTTLKLLPDTARSQFASYTTLGTVKVSGWGVGQKSDYEAIFKNLGSKSVNGNGTSRDGNVNAFITSAGGDSLRYGWCASADGHWLYGNTWHNLYFADYLYPVRPIMSFHIPQAPRGAINGCFTFGNGKMVFFSKGNLQYVGTWQFAEHQWECFGTDQRDNHRDLFGWGTGKNPNNVSAASNEYSWSEWGENEITNGTTGYRTLTYDESQELVKKLKETNRTGPATVNGVHGVVMLCDNWVLPEGCSFTPLSEDGGTNWDSNVYSTEQWTAMEAGGAVFLPCAGQRSMTTTMVVNFFVSYWTSTLGANGDPGIMIFARQWEFGTISKWTGFAVRLVKDAE